MELLDDPETKQTYEKCKYIVKLWEHNFTKKYKRIPSKLDIREANSEVRHAYRKYFQLKTAAIDQSFKDVDGFHSDEEKSQSDNHNDETNNLPQESPQEKTVCTEESDDTSQNVWGSHLNVKTTTKKQNPVKKINLNESISQKLFCGSKLSKRSSRKSLSQRKSEKSTSFSQPSSSFVTFKSEEFLNNLIDDESNDLGGLMISDISKILSQPQKIISQPVNIIQALENKVKPVRNIDAGWLDRASMQNGQSGNYSSNFTLIEPISSCATKLDYDSDDIIDDSEDESPDRSGKVHHVAKKIKSDIPLTSVSQENVNQPVIVPEKPVENAIKTILPEKSSPSVENEIQESERLNHSSRPTKARPKYVESDDEEVDPFHSDNDENDPEFTVGKKERAREKPTLKEPDEGKRKGKKKKSPKKVEKKKRKTKKEERDEQNELNEELPYELEYSVKPRIVKPRYASIKTILTESAQSMQKTDECDKIDDEPLVKSKAQQAKDKLEKKIASGTLNDNYVRIDIKKKIFVRGKGGKNFSKYKKSQWKLKKKALYGPDMDMGGCDGGKLMCFNCGKEGHFARNCKETKGEGLLPLAAVDAEESTIPTLEQASQMARESVLSIRRPTLANNALEPNENPESFEEDDLFESQLLEEAMKIEEQVKQLDVNTYMDNEKIVPPYYNSTEMNETPEEVFDALKKFGHDQFRAGQERAVMRILSGMSTLLTLSTGSGKSLCYQLPAYLYSQRQACITLVISPLVSLMEDQVTGIPSFLHAACLHTNQTKTQREKVLEAISSGKLRVLLISPEAVVAGEKQSGFGSLFRKLPPIAFACIDEVHCVSQWSHNFRPSYLLICRVLRECLGVKTILGLTATATRSTCDSIVDHIRIPDGRNGIIADIPLPTNLHLTVSKDGDRDRALWKLLLSERFKNSASLIVYCTRRDECERIAAFLRTSLKGNDEFKKPVNEKKRKRVETVAEPYHAGLSASRRRSIQNGFMSGALRIVVATVAFGMGINKSDIRGVIHYNMPSNFESYVQEVGRAGRDGLPANCHLFVDSQGRDRNELRRHIFANSIDRHVIRKLLQKIFIPCSCKNVCPKHEVAFSVEETVRALDIPEENIATLLCYLELHSKKYVQLLSPAYTICKVISYGGPMQIRKAAKDCPPLAMALALHDIKENDDPNVIEFAVVDVAAAMGWESGICKHKLKNLEWTVVNNQSKRSTLSVRFSNLGFHLFAPGNLADEELDEALDTLYNRVVDQERNALLQLNAVHDTLMKAAVDSFTKCTKNDENCDTTGLKMKIREYFESPDPLKDICISKSVAVNEEQLVADIISLISLYRDNNFTGRAVARIFHGIQSPNYPAVIWGRCKFWRGHINDDFHTICRIATREILKMR